jgi:tetratricopeptide (TPR) repeat protein
MESYRVSSKVRDRNREYLIQTSSDANLGAVATSVSVNGEAKETVHCPHPDDVSPEEILSLVKMAHGEKKREIEILLEAYHRALDSGSPEMLHHLGTAFHYKGFLDEALELFSTAVRIKPDYHEALNNLGLARMAVGQIDRAVEELSRAVEQRPGFADYRNNLGEAYLANNEAKRAIGEFEQAISINMYYADAYLNLGMAQLALALSNAGRPIEPTTLARIADYFRKASLIYAGYATPQYEEGLTALSQLDLARAQAIFRRIREAKKENHRREFSSFYMKFVTFPDMVTEQVVADRIAFLKGEISKNPSYVDLHAELGHCFLEQARISWQKAVDQFRKGSEINPSLGKIRVALDVTEETYQGIALALRRISEKG